MYDRESVHEGATAVQWRRNGRVVREGEKPARVVAAKGKGAKGGKHQQGGASSASAAASKQPQEEEEASLASGSTRGEQRSVELFGFWQVRHGKPNQLRHGFI